jgi:hypothetical protein
LEKGLRSRLLDEREVTTASSECHLNVLRSLPLVHDLRDLYVLGKINEVIKRITEVTGCKISQNQ